MPWLLAGFLLVHGLLHLVVWLPPAPTEAQSSAPFAPDASALLTAADVPRTAARRLAVTLAASAAATYVLAAAAVAVGLGWAAVTAAVVAAVLGLVLKAVFYNPWLTLGVLLDGLVLSAALLGWPFALT